MKSDITTLDQYLTAYGSALGAQAQRNLDPLHDPARDKNHPLLKKLLRKPYPAQAVVITGAAKALQRQKSLFLIAECGAGKTLQGMGIVHCHAGGKPYRALVFCPGQLTKKWQREVLDTIPNCYTKIIDSGSDLLPLTEYGPPRVAEWYFIARDRAKLGPGWEPACVTRTQTVTTEEMGDGGVVTKKHSKVTSLHCPACGAIALKGKEGEKSKDEGTPYTREDLAKKKRACGACGSPLWQFIRKPDRFEPAKFIHKKLRRFFDYLIIDEVHENKGADTAQANAVGNLAASARKVLAMTGTMIGGYAEHIRPLLFRLSP
ncbi:MAG: DEAD/DEAH box helicase family protein, partial [Gemmataceae bacterium]|nr:DEAD/DEAH box helicase family protein [Gemmataceae bacterium]